MECKMLPENHEEIRIETAAVQVGDSILFQCPHSGTCGHHAGWAFVIKVESGGGGEVILTIDNRHELIYPPAGLVTVRRPRVAVIEGGE